MEKVYSELGDLEQLNFECSEGIMNPFEFLSELGDRCKKLKDVKLSDSEWDEVVDVLNRFSKVYGPIEYVEGLDRKYMKSK